MRCSLSVRLLSVVCCLLFVVVVCGSLFVVRWLLFALSVYVRVVVC